MSCQGTVKSFNGGKGFGFAVVDGEDVFIHIKDCTDGGVPAVGDVLSFDVIEGSKPGSKKASGISGGTGKPEDQKGKGKGKGSGAFTGLVKSFNGQKVWGFIVHEGTDIFFHLKDMVDGSTPQAGDYVQFDLEDNPQKPGSMKARNINGGTGWPEEKGLDKGGDKGKGKGYDKGGWGGDPYGGKGGWGADPYGGKGGYGKDAWGPYGGGGDPYGGKGGYGKDAWGGKGGDSWGDGGWGCGGKGKDYGKAKGGW